MWEFESKPGVLFKNFFLCNDGINGLGLCLSATTTYNYRNITT